MNKLSLKISAILFFTLACTTWAQAAGFSWSVNSVSSKPGELFEVGLMFTGGGEKVNALSGQVVYDQDILTLQEIREVDSIISFWLERPVVGGAGVASFSGIIPGGFDGVISPYRANTSPGRVLNLVFSAKKEGQTEIKLKLPEAFLNSPGGDQVKLDTANSVRVEISNNLDNNAPVLSLQRDLDPPENFIPQVGQDKNIFNNQYFLAFSTRDTGSGVKSYQVQEHSGARPDKGEWMDTNSPHLLLNQKLDKYISVRVTDNVGNERIVTLSPQVGVSGYDYQNVWLIIILLCIVWLFYRFWS